jgi:hypothetical protein
MANYLPSKVVSALVALSSGDMPLEKEAIFSHRMVSGRALRCLDFGPVKEPHARVCLTREGIIGFYSSNLAMPTGSASLLKFSPLVSQSELTLPAKAKRA